MRPRSLHRARDGRPRAWRPIGTSPDARPRWSRRSSLLVCNAGSRRRCMRSSGPGRYLRITPTGFFGDPYAPAGYPAFLRAIYFVSSNLTFTVVLQHLVALVGGTFLYLMMRRLTGRVWLSLVPAGIVFLSGDYIFME